MNKTKDISFQLLCSLHRLQSIRAAEIPLSHSSRSVNWYLALIPLAESEDTIPVTLHPTKLCCDEQL